MKNCTPSKHKRGVLGRVLWASPKKGTYVNAVRKVGKLPGAPRGPHIAARREDIYHA
jgi:hypothetical protein